VRGGFTVGPRGVQGSGPNRAFSAQLGSFPFFFCFYFLFSFIYNSFESKF
jgi:hypothetical protein